MKTPTREELKKMAFDFLEEYFGSSKEFKMSDELLADFALQVLQEHEAKQWHKYPEVKPELDGKYIVFCNYPIIEKTDIKIDYFLNRFYNDYIIAWHKLPEPYKEGGEG